MVHGCMVYTERSEMAAEVSSGTSNASAVSTLDGIQKRARENLVTHTESHASAMNLLQSGE